MQVDLPRITVVTPSFNQAGYLERAIRSVLEQEYPALEYIVMDGGSTDRSIDIIEKYGSYFAYWQSQPDGGQTAAINEGWRRASGEILAWLNSDDYYLPGALAAAASTFREHPQAQLVYGNLRRVDQRGELLGVVGEPYRWRTLLTSHQLIPQPSSFIRREALVHAGPLDESLQYSMDYDFFLRVVRLGRPVWIDVELSAATIHPDAKTTRDRGLAKRETYLVRRRYATGLDAALVRMQPALSWIFHHLPSPARSAINRVRPRANRL